MWHYNYQPLKPHSNGPEYSNTVIEFDGERGFHYSGPAARNSLPSDLHDITDTNAFKKRLKTVLFDRAY